MTGPTDTSAEIERLRIEGLRRMPAWRRLELVDDMNRTLRALALAGLRRRHPTDSTARLRRRLAGLILGEELASQVYGTLEDADRRG